MPGVITPNETGARRATDARSAATVLLVDDEEDIRYLAAMQLERVGGFEVVGEAGDGIEAVRMAARLQPSAILLDVMMPRMDGHTALPELLRVSPRSMIVMVSALSAESQAEPAISAGAFAYVEKEEMATGLGEMLTDNLARFRRALAGETVWAPERPSR